MLRICHFGDMRLDAPFEGVGMAAGERLRDGLRRVFRDIVRLASDGGCDLLLISGNLFCSGFTSRETLLLVRDALSRLTVPVVIAPGDSDPYAPGSVWTSVPWPENVMIFQKDALTYFDLEAAGIPVRVWGWAFTSDKMNFSPLDSGLSPAPDRLNLLCAHTDIYAEKSRLCPTDPKRLCACGCAYAALGGIVPAPEPLTGHGVTAAYCGTPEAHNAAEAGADGVLLVTADGPIRRPIVSAERVTVGTHTYRSCTVDVSGCSRSEDVARRVLPAVVRLGADPSVSVTVDLTGGIDAEYLPDPRHIATLLLSGLDSDGIHPGSLDVRDLTRPVPGDEAEALDLRGEFCRLLSPALSTGSEDDGQLAARALRLGLAALNGKNLM